MDRKECLEAAGKAVLTDRENTYKAGSGKENRFSESNSIRQAS